MTNYIEGSGKYGVLVKWSQGGTTTYYYEDNVTRNRNFARIKSEVGSKEKVSKKNR
jgi:hypothetical protein